MNSNNTIIIVNMPGAVLQQKKYNSICFRVGGLECCSINSPTLYSNTVCKYLPSPSLPPQPPFPQPPPPPPPEPCIDIDDISGYTLEVNYDRRDCTVNHVCNRAIFNVYINNIFVGKANLNNALTGANVHRSFTIPNNITAQNNIYEIKLVKDASIPIAHDGIAQVIIRDGDRIVFQSCLPNDRVVFIPRCPPPPPPPL